MPRKKEPTLHGTTATASPRISPKGGITNELGELLRSLMATLGTAYAEDAAETVTAPLELAKNQVLAARKATQESATL